MFSRLPIVIFLLLATIQIITASPTPSTIARRSTDITCGGKYPFAGSGFAKRPDGCSSWSENPNQIPDKWGSANFRGVCNDHDTCYYTVGSSVDGCNDNFCRGLRDACKKAYCKSLLCEPTLYRTCSAAADGYCAGARAWSGSVFKKAQDMQKGYETCIKGSGGVAAPKVCSDGSKEGSSWVVKDKTTCLMKTSACRNQKIVVVSQVRILGCVVP